MRTHSDIDRGLAVSMRQLAQTAGASSESAKQVLTATERGRIAVQETVQNMNIRRRCNACLIRSEAWGTDHWRFHKSCRRSGILPHKQIFWLVTFLFKGPFVTAQYLYWAAPSLENEVAQVYKAGQIFSPKFKHSAIIGSQHTKLSLIHKVVPNASTILVDGAAFNETSRRYDTRFL